MAACMHDALLLYPGLEGVNEVKKNRRPMLSRVPGFSTDPFFNKINSLIFTVKGRGPYQPLRRFHKSA